jgi:hypothetical protein
MTGIGQWRRQEETKSRETSLCQFDALNGTGQRLKTAKTDGQKRASFRPQRKTKGRMRIEFHITTWASKL